MHNYTVPAVLKAWIDQIVRIHRSFASTPAGKVGKLDGTAPPSGVRSDDRDSWRAGVSF
jgi:hypothetical protein